jgi:hypothetical protein
MLATPGERGLWGGEVLPALGHPATDGGDQDGALYTLDDEHGSRYWFLVRLAHWL